MQQISAIIVDDEPLAREGLSIRMREQTDFDVLAECADGKEALGSIRDLKPDVVFVDIEMPGMTGLEMLKALRKEVRQLPKVVFTTAYKDFALKAFECDAFDYLLKPFSEQRLSDCLDKLRNAQAEGLALAERRHLDSLISRKTGKSLKGFINALENQEGFDDVQNTLSLKSGYDWLRINTSSIFWIEAAGDYMCVHTQSGNHIIRQTLKQFEVQLEPTQFPRVNRSAIINLQHACKFTPNSNGEYFALLSNGDEVKISRKYKFKLDELMSES